MKYLIVALILALLASVALLLPHVAGAQDKARLDVSVPASDDLQIIEDQQARAFKFMIDGKEVARLGAGGLHVFGNISYGGTLSDVGQSEVQAGAQ